MSRRSLNAPWLTAVLVTAGLVGLTVFAAAPAQAAGFIVDSLADEPDAALDGNCVSTPSGVCTLRAALQEANNLAGDDTITFGVNGTLTLARSGADNTALDGDLDVLANGQVTITGNGPGTTIIDGGGVDRVFDVQAGASLVLNALTVQGGAVTGTNGGGLLNAGTLTLSQVEVKDNHANGFGFGGGLASGGALTVDNGSAVTGNTAAYGGGVYLSGGTLTMARTLVAGNDSGNVGGGLYVEGGLARLTNVTLRLNTAADTGGGAYNGAGLDLLNVTASENTAPNGGAGVYGALAPTVKNTILAGNTGADCGGNLFSQGNNFIGSAAGCAVGGSSAGNLAGASPLGGFSGGVYVLNTGSAAIDAGAVAGCPAVDQIGNTRPKDGNGDLNAICDMGAFEAPTVLPTNTPTATQTGTPAPTATPAPTSAVSATPAPQDTRAPTPTSVRAVGSAGGAFNCAGWQVTIPAGVVPDGGGLDCGSYDPASAPAAPAGFQLLRHTVNVNVYDNQGRWLTTFAKSLSFCYPYGDADLAAAGGRADGLVIQTAPIGGAWGALTTTVDASARRACASVNHLTLFELSARGAAAATVDYVVRTGDTLFLIAVRFNTTVDALKALNGLTSDRILVGQVLKVPGAPAPSATSVPPSGSPTVHIVQTGENLFRIALRYNTTVAALQALNGLGGSIRIYAGQRLVVAGTTATATPTPRPGTATPVTPAPGVRTHRVQPGENLFRLALRYGTTVAALQAANGLGDSIVIYAGRDLIIPGPAATGSATPRPATTYVVQAGDTLFRIALRFSITVTDLQRANGLAGTLIYIGQTLQIP